MDITKQCKNCGNDFNFKSKRKIYCSNNCSAQAFRNKDKEASKAKDLAYYSKNRESILKRKRDYLKNNPDIRKNIKLKQRYGITIEIFNQMLKDQDNKCKICNKEQNLHVDHCHKTGEVRGLLCNGCNRGLGFFSENAESLINAAKYLEKK